MSTLASTAMPTVSRMPAMPGSVRTGRRRIEPPESVKKLAVEGVSGFGE